MIDPAALMQQMRTDAARGLSPLAVCRNMLTAYAFPKSDREALESVLDELERLREQVAEREPITTIWGKIC